MNPIITFGSIVLSLIIFLYLFYIYYGDMGALRAYVITLLILVVFMSVGLIIEMRKNNKDDDKK
jgi:TctA family transporter